jgi:UDP-N-acetylglucosamine diphosphorylase/glucosamine-1-phosphate N-acetyltransferase
VSRALVLFEDRHWRSLRPLTDATPVPALARGGSTLAGRWLRATGAPLLAIEARPGALSLWRDRPAAPAERAAEAADVLAINAAALPGTTLEAALAERAPGIVTCEGRIVAARFSAAAVRPGLGRGDRFEDFLARLELPRHETAASFITHPWHLIEENAAAIERDLGAGPFEKRGEIHRLASLESPEAIAVEEGARIDAFAVLDARGGPIRIGRGALIAAHTLVTGPCVVGPGTQLLGGAVGRSTIGPECRIQGEVEECLWQGFANKRHHGFVGHSVIGEWVNLGALTTTSDLKNNYGPVRVWVDGRELDSGLSKIGAFIGAHSKTGIGTLLPTGASVGVGSNLFGGGRFAPKHVPPFSWWDGERTIEHRLEEFLATARRATARRDRPLSPAEEQALRALFAATEPERSPAAGRARSTPARA